MMRVLHVLDHSLPLHSGYTFRTRAIVREQQKMDWETLLLTSPRQGECADEEHVEDLHFYRTPCSKGLSSRLPVVRELAEMRATTRRITSLVMSARPDVLHAHSPVLNAIPALFVGRRFQIPVVYEVRAFWEDAAVDHGSTREGSVRYRLTKGLETFALQHSDHVTTICEGLRNDIVARGVSPSKITVIPNAVDIDSFSPSGVPDAALKASLGLDKNTVIGFVGSFYAYEGLDILLDAMPEIAKHNPNVRILLVGGGPQEEALKRQAMQLGITDKTVFVGRVPHSEVQRYYDLIDVLAYPRYSMRLTELVTPLKPLEAMAQGRILVASDVGGHRELINNGHNGILFSAGSATSLASAVLAALEQRDRWPGLREAGRKLVEVERNWATSVAKYIGPFEALTRTRRLAIDS